MLFDIRQSAIKTHCLLEPLELFVLPNMMTAIAPSISSSTLLPGRSPHYGDEIVFARVIRHTLEPCFFGTYFTR